MLNLRHIEVFHAIMRTGSVTAAAKSLHVTQPAVSAVLKHLESRLDFRLFERVGGKLQPTPEALALMPDVDEIFGRLDAIARLTQDLAGGRLGSLSLAASSPIANGVLPKTIARFLKDKPQVRVALQTLASPQVLDRVASREAELGVAYGPLEHSEVVCTPLWRAGIGCIMREDHPLARRETIDIRELVAYDLITYLPQALLRPYVDQAFQAAGIAPALTVQVGQAITGIALAHQGTGVALVETNLLAALPLPGLVARELAAPIALNILLLQHRSAPRSALHEQFVRYLREDDSGPAG